MERILHGSSYPSVDMLNEFCSHIFFYLETKVKILAERDRASAEAAFKALDTNADGR